MSINDFTGRCGVRRCDAWNVGMHANRAPRVVVAVLIAAGLALAAAASCQPSSKESDQPKTYVDRLSARYDDWSRSLGVPTLNEASVAVWWTRGMHLPRPGDDLSDPRIVIAIWPSGDVVWSDDRIVGGAPYSTGRVDAAAAENATRAIYDVVAPVGDRIQFGPDAAYTTISARADGDTVELASWHPGFEQNPKLTCAPDGGVSSLSGRTREEANATWTDDYREFREAWDRALELTFAVVAQARAR